MTTTFACIYVQCTLYIVQYDTHVSLYVYYTSILQFCIQMCICMANTSGGNATFCADSQAPDSARTALSIVIPNCIVRGH